MITHLLVKRQTGFTLLEVLVTAVILAVGLLGLAGLQVFGLRNNHNAYMRSQANLLAYDMIDRMRANRGGFANGSYNNPAATEHGSCVSTTGCNTEEMAEHDIFEWSNNCSELLPNCVVVVCLDNTPDDGTPTSFECSNTASTYAIKVWWDDERAGTGNFKRFSTSFQP